MAQFIIRHCKRNNTCLPATIQWLLLSYCNSWNLRTLFVISIVLLLAMLAYCPFVFSSACNETLLTTSLSLRQFYREYNCQLITCPSKEPFSYEELPENNRVIEFSRATRHCGLCVAWWCLIFHLWVWYAYVIDSEAVSCFSVSLPVASHSPPQLLSHRKNTCP